jgi:hypothetical protein
MIPGHQQMRQCSRSQASEDLPKPRDDEAGRRTEEQGGTQASGPSLWRRARGWQLQGRRPATALYLRNVTAAVLPLIVAALAILAFHYAYSLATVKAVYRTNAQREIALDVLRLERFFAERQSILIGIARTMTVPAGDLLNNMGELTESESQLGAFFEGLYLDDLDGFFLGSLVEGFNFCYGAYF